MEKNMPNEKENGELTVTEVIKEKFVVGLLMIAVIIEDTIIIAAIIIGLWALQKLTNFLGMQTEYPVMVLITISEIISIVLYMILVISGIYGVLSLIKYTRRSKK
jgi:hypothetical protein